MRFRTTLQTASSRRFAICGVFSVAGCLAVWTTALTAKTALAAPICEVRGRPHLEGRVADAQSRVTSRTVDIRLGQAAEVFVVLPGRLHGRTVLFSESGAPGHTSWTESGCGPIETVWKRVEPRMAHRETPSPNPSIQVYANAVVFGPKHGKWIGYDKLEYFETLLPIEGISGLRYAVRDAQPTEAQETRLTGQEGLGTMRLAATVRWNGAEYATPDVRDVDGTVSDAVFRYTVRSGDGFLGWLTSYFNVPYVFGSAGEKSRNQTERYVGADCADILVGALHRAGLRQIAYSNVGGVMDQLSKRTVPARITACDPVKLDACTNVSEPPLRFGADVLPGDILAVDYTGARELPRAWDHIVVLIEDRGPNGIPDGVLGPHDLVADSGDELALKFAPLNQQGNVRVQAARPQKVVIR